MSGSSSSATSSVPRIAIVDRRQQREQREERHELDGHDRRRDRLAREARLAHERALVEQRRRRAQHRLAEEDPHDEPDQQEQRVVSAVGPGDLEEHAEHEVVGAHQHERVDEVPQHPERRALVLLAQLAPDHLLEEVAVGHRPMYRGSEPCPALSLRAQRCTRAERGLGTRCLAPADLGT